MILITGATGLIGRQVVAQLMAEKRALRCLLPQPKQRQLPWDRWMEGAPEIITGNSWNEEALFAAVSGAHTIIHLENALWWGRTRDLERVEIVGTRNLIAAARAARVGRIITVSQLGANPASAFPLLRIKGQVEDLIRQSGLAYTILRSGVVFGREDAFANHIAMLLPVSPLFLVMPGYGEIILHPIYIDDLAEAITRSLERIDTVDQTIEIGGPEYMTFEDLIRTVMRVTGSERSILAVPPYLIRWWLRIYRIVFPRTLITPQWLDILAASRTAHLGNSYTYFGLYPRRFEDTLLTYMPRQHYFWRALRYVFRRHPRGQ